MVSDKGSQGFEVEGGMRLFSHLAGLNLDGGSVTDTGDRYALIIDQVMFQSGPTRCVRLEVRFFASDQGNGAFVGESGSATFDPAVA